MEMFEEQANERWTEIMKFWTKEEYRWLYAVLGLLAGVLFWPFLTSTESFLGDLFPEAAGILFTVVVLDRLNERRLRSERKKALMRQLGSQSNEFSLEAKRLLEMEDGWLEEALREKNFRRANWKGMIFPNNTDLSGIDLFRANLIESKLMGVNLTDAKVIQADLTKAVLRHTNLTDADLSNAVLTSARLWSAILHKADLTAANLEGAKLQGARLEGAILTDVKYDKKTCLPDGSHWEQGTEMSRFTDPAHPKFWRSDSPYVLDYCEDNDEV